MNLPTPPWYKMLNRRLEGVEWLVNVLLILVIVVCCYMLFFGDRVTKTTWAVYLISP